MSDLEHIDGQDFCWIRNADDIAVQEQQAIAVYVNPRGNVVLRQGAYPEDDDVIVVSPVNAQALVAAILNAASIDGAAAETGPPRAKDPTAAERQRRYRERNGRNGHDDRNGAPPLALIADTKGAAE